MAQTQCGRIWQAPPYAKRIPAILLTALSLTIWQVPTAWSQAEGDALIKKHLGDEDPAAVMDDIARQQAERKKQAQERAIIEAEVRDTMRKIRSRLFELELFLAGLKDGIVATDCSEVVRLADQIQELEALVENFSGKCGTIPVSAQESRKVCTTRLQEYSDELQVMRESKATLEKDCPSGVTP